MPAHISKSQNGISKASSRIAAKISKDKKFKVEFIQIERKLNLSRMKALVSFPFALA
jgi:hypothetical protein